MAKTSASTIIEREFRERTGHLDLGNCNLGEIPAVVWTEMPWLRRLNLAHNYVDWEQDEWVFSANMGLQNNLDRLPEGPANLPELEWLTLGGWVENRDLRKLEPVAGLKNLRYLDCSSTDVRDLAPVQGLSQLIWLDCSNTYVEDLGPLAGLKGLSVLVMHHTRVADLSPLAGLERLKYLDCSHARVLDHGPLAHLPGLELLG